MQTGLKSTCNKEHKAVLWLIKFLISLLKWYLLIQFITAFRILTTRFHSQYSENAMLALRFFIPKAFVQQDECFGKNYLSFLDFTHNYEQTSGIFVPWPCIDYCEASNNFVCFVVLCPKSTAMVMAGRSVHLTTLFPGQAWTSSLPVLHAHTLACNWQPILNDSAEGRRMTVENISWLISTKVWDRAVMELATPGSAVKLASVARHVTDCATRPGKEASKKK